jgi:asparagine synthase (glutamine-hydrolysing)
MCGIAGIINPTARSEGNVDVVSMMASMLEKIAHRGPDGTGIWNTESSSVVLGHKRLAIVDLNPNANQPMVRSDGDYSIVFNGEIYNHRELRASLEKLGAAFETDHSDTETLIVGYKHWGLNTLLEKVNGMFAFSIYDRAENKLILARDRVGIKSLYYCFVDNRFLFSSEIKAIFASGLIKPELNRACMNQYLASRSVQAPETLFKGIKKLQSSTALIVDLDTLEHSQIEYWNPLYQTVDMGIKTEGDLEERLSSLIGSSLDYRLEADVPVGIFLSGGVDSNYLLSQLAQKRDGIQSFTASFRDNQGYDESKDAIAMALKFGAQFNDIPINSDNYIGILEKMVYFQEEPISAPVCVPIYYLSEAARNEGVPVILAGEGADEILVGYENWARIRKLQKVLDIWSCSWVGKVGKLQSLRSRFPITSPIRDLFMRAGDNKPLFWGGAMEMSADLRAELLGKSAQNLHQELFQETVESHYKDFLGKRGKSDISNWMTYMDLKQRLPELMLPRLDRMGMAHSIEGRVPYLDHRVVELVFSTPESVLAAGNTGKSSLKNIAAPELGDEFVFRRKKGFQAPVSDWKDEGFSKYIECLKLFAERTGLFSKEGIELILEDQGRRYFTLINFMLWYLIFIENVLEDVIPDLVRWDQY